MPNGISPTSRISEKGQVTVPKKLREAVGLAPGDFVVYEVRGNEIILRRMQAFDAPFHRGVSAALDEWNSEEDDEAFRDL